jgi:hypothetical protein
VRSAGEKRVRAAWYNRGRGARGVKLAEARDPTSQKVIIKTRVVVHDKVGGGGGGGARSMMRHTLYVERDGAGRDGSEVKVFDEELDRADGAAFVDRCADDRHHFRIIISPENGIEMETGPIDGHSKVCASPGNDGKRSGNNGKRRKRHRARAQQRQASCCSARATLAFKANVR